MPEDVEDALTALAAHPFVLQLASADASLPGGPPSWDGTVPHAGPARADREPPCEWRAVPPSADLKTSTSKPT